MNAGASLIPAALVALLAAVVSVRGEGGSSPPAPAPGARQPSADPSRRHVFYLHARILELRGRSAASKRHGPYDYDGILRALADRTFVVHSEVRPAETTLAYGETVAAEARSLLAAGVPPEKVTVVGFSKGGFLAMAASAALRQPKVNFVILAGCGIGPWRSELLPRIAPRLQGRILSLYDAADEEASSCREAFDLAAGLEAREIRLRTGLGHGLFYAPRAEWLDPVARWALRPP